MPQAHKLLHFEGFSIVLERLKNCGTDFSQINSYHFGCKPTVVLILSVSSGKNRAKTALGKGNSLDTAWRNALSKISSAWDTKEQARWIKVDIVHSIVRLPVEIIARRISKLRRNYFRNNLSFDMDFNVAVLEQEINGSGSFKKGASGENAICIRKIKQYLKAYRFGPRLSIKADNFDFWYTFDTLGYFFDYSDPSRKSYKLSSGGFTNGTRIVEEISTEIPQIIQSSGCFLAHQLLSTGKFIYGYFPVTNSVIPTYNILRHCTTLYSMLEAWEITNNFEIFGTVDNGINYIINSSMIKREKEYFIFDESNYNEVKLGAQAAFIILIAKYTTLTQDQKYVEYATCVANGIVKRFVNHETGSFVHVLNKEDLSLKERFRIIYYDGEAVLAFLRLYAVNRDLKWLTAAKLAFDYFVEAEHWRHCDHWLAYCSHEITKFFPDEKYYRFGLKNVFSKIDFILYRDTAYPTLLELLMSSLLMIRSLIDSGHSHLLKEYDIEKFVNAIHHRARHQISSHFYPEASMYFEEPLRIVGSFFVRHHSFRVRIDDVEHFISGFSLYLRHVIQSNKGECFTSLQKLKINKAKI